MSSIFLPYCRTGGRAALAIGLAATLAAVSGPLIAQTTPAPDTPRLFIEAFRSTDSLGRRIAEQLRVAVQAQIAPTKLWVLPTTFIEGSRDVGAPDDFGAAWAWRDLR